MARELQNNQKWNVMEFNEKRVITYRGLCPIDTKFFSFTCFIDHCYILLNNWLLKIVQKNYFGIITAVFRRIFFQFSSIFVEMVKVFLTAVSKLIILRRNVQTSLFTINDRYKWRMTNHMNKRISFCYETVGSNCCILL